MTTSRKTYPGVDYVAQSRVVTSGAGEPIPRYSAQLLRSRSRYGGFERRGWTLFLNVRGMRMVIGTR
jgi:hypothetical protein